MIPRPFLAVLTAAGLAAALSACSKPTETHATQATPAGAEAPPVDIEAEAEKAAAAIDESNADAELERLKSELQSE